MEKSFKLGIDTFKHKKIKFTITILLMVFTLLFLSLADTLASYNINKAHEKLLKEKNIHDVQIQKLRYYQDISNIDQLPLKEEDITSIQDKIKNQGTVIYQIHQQYNNLNGIDLFQLSTNYDNVYNDIYTPIDIIETYDFESLISNSIIGTFPKNNNEILISNYLADLIIQNGVPLEEEDDYGLVKTFKPSSYQEIIDSNYLVPFGAENRVKISGIINYDISVYETLKNKKYDDLTNNERKLLNSFHLETNHVYNKIYVKNGFINHLTITPTNLLIDNNQYRLELKNNVSSESGYYIHPAILNKEISYFDGTEWKTVDHLEKNEIILNFRQLQQINENDFQQQLQKYINRNPDKNPLDLEKEFLANYLANTSLIGIEGTFKIYEGRSFNVNNPDAVFENLKVIGITGLSTDTSPCNYFSEQLLKDYQVETIQKTGILVDTKNVQNVFVLFPYGASYTVQSPYSSNVNTMVQLTTILKQISFYASMVLLIFTICLISNFIFTSIHYRKKEIGVLRALGARSLDVMKIFLWEGCIMALTAGILGSILLVISSHILNIIILNETPLLLTPFLLGIRQFILIFVLVFMVVIISSIIPLKKISKMKPIEAILNK